MANGPFIPVGRIILFVLSDLLAQVPFGNLPGMLHTGGISFSVPFSPSVQR